MFCANCGKEVSNIGNFCHYCGFKTSNEIKENKIVTPEVVNSNLKNENIVTNVIKIFIASFFLLGVWYYLISIFGIFGENVKAIGSLFSLGLIIYLWIKGYKRIFKK